MFRRMLAIAVFLVCSLCFAADAQTRTFVAYVGQYTATVSYNLNDMVSSGGVFYISLAADNLGADPGSSPLRWVALGSTAGATGPAGPAGPVGSQGPQGLTGAQGPAGLAGPSGLSVTFRGVWSSKTVYAIGDAVSYADGSSYISITNANSGNVPASSPSGWGLLAQAGANGSAGPVGPTGPAGPIGLTGLTGAAGLQGPPGPQGLPGTQGVIGPQGLPGPQGVPGLQGVPGVPGQLGPSGASGPPVTFRGAWSNTIAYALGDAVSSVDGSSYISLVNANSGNTPSSTPSAWGLLAQAGANGTPGAAGPTGAPGPRGLPGIPGAIGLPGISGPPIIFRGAWSNTTAYALGDAVSYVDGSSYISLVSANNGNTPSSTPSAWGLLAQAGANGTSFDSSTLSAALAANNSSLLSSAPFSNTVATTGIAAALSYLFPSVVNLFDPNRSTSNLYIDQASGTTRTAPSQNSITGYIPVTPGSTVISNTRSDLLCCGLGGYAFYSSDFSYVSGGIAPAAVPITVPSGAAFYRQSYSTAENPTMMIISGSSLPGSYIPFTQSPYILTPDKLQAVLTPGMVSPWSGKRLGVFGDSISALFNNAWQNIVLTQNSMTLGFQDAHAGRTTYSLFENYGGDGLGTTTGDASAGGMTTGTTLAQDLANVDLLIIEIGTNDNNSGFPLGSPTDAPASPGLGASNISLCAAWNYILNTLQAANPNMRIVWAGPYSYNPLNGHGGGPVAQNAAIAAAQQTVMGQHGVPYLNALSEVGFNAQNWSVMLGDGLHPSAAGFVRYGGYIAQKIKQFP